MVFVYFRPLAALVGYFLGGGRFVPILISEYTGLSRDLVSLCSGLDFDVMCWEFPACALFLAIEQPEDACGLVSQQLLVRHCLTKCKLSVD